MSREPIESDPKNSSDKILNKLNPFRKKSPRKIVKSTSWSPEYENSEALQSNTVKNINDLNIDPKIIDIFCEPAREALKCIKENLFLFFRLQPLTTIENTPQNKHKNSISIEPAFAKFKYFECKLHAYKTSILGLKIAIPHATELNNQLNTHLSELFAETELVWELRSNTSHHKPTKNTLSQLIIWLPTTESLINFNRLMQMHIDKETTQLGNFLEDPKSFQNDTSSTFKPRALSATHFIAEIVPIFQQAMITITNSEAYEQLLQKIFKQEYFQEEQEEYDDNQINNLNQQAQISNAIQVSELTLKNTIIKVSPNFRQQIKDTTQKYQAMIIMLKNYLLFQTSPQPYQHTPLTKMDITFTCDDENFVLKSSILVTLQLLNTQKQLDELLELPAINDLQPKIVTDNKQNSAVTTLRLNILTSTDITNTYQYLYDWQQQCLNNISSNSITALSKAPKKLTPKSTNENSLKSRYSGSFKLWPFPQRSLNRKEKLVSDDDVNSANSAPLLSKYNKL